MYIFGIKYVPVLILTSWGDRCSKLSVVFTCKGKIQQAQNIKIPWIIMSQPETKNSVLELRFQEFFFPA